MQMSEYNRIGVVVGTRPEIIKMAPVIRTIEQHDMLDIYLIHTGQHYDHNMSGTFFDELELPTPDSRLQIGSGDHASQTGNCMIKLSEDIKDINLDYLLAQGDTNSVVASAMVASKSSFPFGHVEAGLRSYDRNMPEEINRLVADVVAAQAFAPTENSKRILQSENVQADIIQTGNTVVDACSQHIELSREKSGILQELGIDKQEFILCTIHRPINTSNDDRFQKIIDSLIQLEVPVVFPAHPRINNKISALSVDPQNLMIIEPAKYLDFLLMEASATLIVTDSGGVQEEASILNTPCVTVRPNTERPETVTAGVNKLVEPDEICSVVHDILHNPDVYDAMMGSTDLFGDGKASKKIVDSVLDII